MALNIDTAHAFRTHDERTRLIAAVMAATEHDESGWLELKSSLDLSSKKGQFALARAILGMSNRDPDFAAQWCEGTAYVIIGADHDGCHGVTTVDHVDLENGLASYLGTGADSPRWSPDYVKVDGRDVLVVTIEASRYGDRIKTLRREYDGARAGTIFVRGKAKTEPATPGEIIMLEDRRLRGVQDPAMSLTVTGSVRDPGLMRVADYRDPKVLREWLSDEQREVTSSAPPAEPTGLDVGYRARIVQGAFGGTSRASYEREVKTYLKECESRLATVVRGVAFRSRSNEFWVTATNTEQTTMESVRVCVEIDVMTAQVLLAPPSNSRLPRRPRYDLLSHAVLIPPVHAFTEDWTVASKSPGAASLQHARGKWQVIWSMGDLHPRQEMRGRAVAVIPAKSTDTVEIRCSATAKNRHGVATGSQRLSVVPDQVIAVGHGSSLAHE